MVKVKEYKTDIEIAREAKMAEIAEIAYMLKLSDDEWEPYGKYKAKLSLNILERRKNVEDGKLVLVTSISPTPAGEGKSTVVVGLGQALQRLGKNAIVTLREPSLGPTMGIKGGASGGGYSQVLPMEDINLHFTGDIHAITTANNLLASIIDNHVYHGNELNIDIRRIIWKRAVDLNDRALRNIVIGLGGASQGVPREDGFQITVASEIMAILCLARDLQDLKERLAKIVVAYDTKKKPVTVKDLGVEGALAAVLKEAIKPNLVQTMENTPAIIHGGPFANIAHGCNSLIATKMASKLGDYVITEAGFGADLGAEKFFNIKSRVGQLHPQAVVVVVTARALKMHGGVKKSELHKENVRALKPGIDNLAKHLETIEAFGIPYVVAINRFVTDTDNEIRYIEEWCKEHNVRVAVADVWEKGGEGGIGLAEQVLDILEKEEAKFSPIYSLHDTIENKIKTIARIVYGAKDVHFTAKAKRQIETFVENGWDNLPICMAKTQYSLSDDPNKLGRPEDFTITIRELRPSIGAGFIVALTGDMMTMPGLPKVPAALRMDIDDCGNVKGLF